jgi:uncharacterized protein (TIGR00297 family)
VYSRFRATATASGIIVVAFQTLVFYQSLGLRGAILFVLVPVLGTIASMVREQKAPKAGKTETRSWQNAVANAGIATILGAATMVVTTRHARRILAVIIVASLSATLSDTLSHELGVTFGRTARLITSFHKVNPGTNGAVSAFGSLVALLSAFIFPCIAAGFELISSKDIFTIGLSALVGNLVDSVLGATIEGWGWIGNNLVNFACVLSASIFVLVLVR